MPSGEISEDVFSEEESLSDLGLGGAEDDAGYEDEQDLSDAYEGTEEDSEYMAEEAAEAEEESADAADQYTEVQRRLKLAAYYQELTNSSIFTGNSRESKLVAREVRAFALSRMNALVGIGVGTTTSSGETAFSDAQIDVLRQLADRLLEKQGSAQPTLRPLAPPAPVRRPTVAPPRSAVTQARMQQPGPARPAARPAGRPVPVQGKKPLRKGEKPAKEDLSRYPLDEPFEENGRMYKVTTSPHPGEDGRAKRVKLDVTPQVRPPNAIPTPRREHMNLISAQHAHTVIDRNNDNAVMRKAAAISMSSD